MPPCLPLCKTLSPYLHPSLSPGLLVPQGAGTPFACPLKSHIPWADVYNPVCGCRGGNPDRGWGWRAGGGPVLVTTHSLECPQSHQGGALGGVSEEHYCHRPLWYPEPLLLTYTQSWDSTGSRRSWVWHRESGVSEAGSGGTHALVFALLFAPWVSEPYLLCLQWGMGRPCSDSSPLFGRNSK